MKRKPFFQSFVNMKSLSTSQTIKEVENDRRAEEKDRGKVCKNTLIGKLHFLSIVFL